MSKNCGPSSSSSAGRLRQEPSTSKNCLASSAKGGLFLKLPITPHRVVESAIFSLSHRVLPSGGKCNFFTFASSSFGKSWTSFL